MKHLKVLAIVLFLGSQAVMAQKFAYIDTDYILSHVPEYATAQQTLNQFSSNWQAEIEQKYENIEKLTQAYQAEKVLLPADMRKKREEEIAQKRTEAREMQKQKFGVDGELFSKREELIAPIQDQMYEAIKEVATSRSYMVIFDKGTQSNMLYSNPKYDVSDLVIKKMGLTPGETIESNSEGKDEAGSKAGGGQTRPSGGSKSPSGGKTSVPRGGKK